MPFGTYEEDNAIFTDDVPDHIVGIIQGGHGLLQVNNVDAIALSVDEGFHLRIPTPCAMAEVHPCLQ